MRSSRLLSALVVLCGLSSNAHGGFDPGLSYDQYLLYVGSYINTTGFGRIGESFTPQTNSIQFAAFGFYGADGDFSLQVQLYQGVGVNGPLLATSQTTSFTQDYGLSSYPGALGYFFFDNPITLDPGSEYTLMLNEVSGGTVEIAAVSAGQQGSLGILGGKPYPGYPGQPDFNLAFAEGSILPSVVPEPPSLGLLGLSIPGFFAAIRLRGRGRVD